MEKFEVVILGCGCALPTSRHFNAAQVVNLRNKLFLIDCGEGTQIQFRRNKLNFNKLGHIFISHLHGDHFFGLMGLISTFNLLGRTAQLYVHAPAPLRNILQPQIDYFCQEMNYEVTLDEIDSTKHQLIYEDRSVEVWSLPLNHRVPCCGFLFKEKPLKKHIIADKIKQYNIPIYAINSIKDSKDYTLPDGTIIPNDQLTTPADPTRSYAYCSDTRYLPQLAEYLQDLDILFHEATFGEDKKNLAFATYHSTAAQAATLAKECHAKKLFIGHYSARYDDENILLNEAREIFPETFLTKEDEIIQI
ncbi:MAG: ribonuclease Z [Bacteroidaceae bacterium]|nr:ribonuclease Z [Bacteroidaceae bacterium]